MLIFTSQGAKSGALIESESGAAPQAELCPETVRVCETVSYAHQHGVIHRDLKPDNVMVGEFGETYVLDWGLAKVLGRPGGIANADPSQLEPVVRTQRSQSHPTRMGTVAGTPAYMAPEQAEGALDQIDARTDVFSLGVILYELLTGTTPIRQQRIQQEAFDPVRAAV